MFLAAIGVLALTAAGIVAYGWWGVTTPMHVKDGEVVPFTIARGESVANISRNLARFGLVRRKEFFRYYVHMQGQGARLQAGEYALQRDMNIPEITALFVEGRVVPNETTVTFPEGFSVKDMDGALAEKKLLPSGAFYRLAKDWEGYLFPDTYRFRKDATATTVRDALIGNFKKKFTAAMRQDAALQLQKAHPRDVEAKNDCAFLSDLSTPPRSDTWCSGDVIVTVASLIEREVRTPEDMKIVSGILWKRLQLGIPLQVDATIVYLSGKKNGEVTYDDLKIESPYNTYLHRGLPPGPIANPGLAALMAAIHPQASQYLYYLSRPTGETVFSKTLEEHNAAIARYLK